jgi:hypothetical protein
MQNNISSWSALFYFGVNLFVLNLSAGWNNFWVSPNFLASYMLSASMTGNRNIVIDVIFFGLISVFFGFLLHKSTNYGFLWWLIIGVMLICAYPFVDLRGL